MKKITQKIIYILPFFILTGCGEADHTDLKNWVKGQEQTVKGKVEPLPRSLDYMAIPFEGAPSIDPFKPRQLGQAVDSNKNNKNQLTPEVNRRKEPLEYYNLSELKIMGFVKKDGRDYVSVKTSRDNVVHVLTIGNYMGTNYGKIIKIENDVLTLREIIYQGDEWVEKNLEISPLAEPTIAQNNKK